MQLKRQIGQEWPQFCSHPVKLRCPWEAGIPGNENSDNFTNFDVFETLIKENSKTKESISNVDNILS